MNRIEAIKELIAQELISDQQMLLNRLNKIYNIETNQAAISRDLRKIGVIKRLEKGKMVYTLPSVDVQSELLALALVSIEHNETMIVIKTHPALADFVGDCIDQHPDLEILGCISGENTVFVAPKSTKDIAKTYEDLCKKFYFKKEVKNEK